MSESKCTVMQLIPNMRAGGAQALLKEYAINYKGIFDLIIVTLYGNEKSENINAIKKYSNVKIISVYKSNSFFYRFVNKFFSNIVIPIRLNKIVEENNVKIVHGHLLCGRLIQMIVHKHKNMSLFYTCHTDPRRMFVDVAPQELLIVKNLVEKNKIKVIALHENAKEELVRYFGKNVFVLENGIDFDKYQKVDEDIFLIKKSIGLPLDSFVIGHVGRFDKVKNHEFIIKIFVELIKQKPNAFLLLIGTGSLENKIIKMAKEHNIFDKIVILKDREDIYRLLHVMDVFLFPSLKEGLSMSLLEAQVSGVKCVISDTIDKANILSKQTISVKLEDDVERWVETILNSELEVEDFGNIEKYNIKNVLRKLEKMYQNN